MNELFYKLANAVVNMDEDLAKEIANDIVNQKLNIADAIQYGLVCGMDRVGELFENEEYFIAEILICADIMDASMEVFKPHLNTEDIQSKGRIIIGSIFGDTHDIGKNIVTLMLKGSGYEVLDLGRDVSAENFVDSAIAFNADIIAISTLMTTTMNNIGDVVALLSKRNIRDEFKVIIGGKPCSTSFAKKIGADGYSSSATSAVRLVKQLLHD